MNKTINIDSLFLAACKYEQSGLLYIAQKHLNQVLEVEPEHLEALKKLASIYGAS